MNIVYNVYDEAMNTPSKIKQVVLNGITSITADMDQIYIHKGNALVDTIHYLDIISFIVKEWKWVQKRASNVY